MNRRRCLRSKRGGGALVETGDCLSRDFPVRARAPWTLAEFEAQVACFRGESPWIPGWYARRLRAINERIPGGGQCSGRSWEKTRARIKAYSSRWVSLPLI